MPKSLLVADDSLTIRKVIGMILSSEDVRVLSVDNGLEAVSKARELHPDLVLADVTMPGMSGYEVCEAIKSDPNTHGIPVLLLAGSFEPFDENRARAAQADAHLMKPFDSQALLTKIWDLLGMSGEAVPASRSAQPITALPPGQTPRTPTAPAFPTPMRVVPPAGSSAPGRAGGGMPMPSAPPRPSMPVGPNPTWASTGGSPFAQAPARPASPLGPGGSQPARGSFPGQRPPQPGPAFGRPPAGQGGPAMPPPRTPTGSAPAWAQNAPGPGRPAVPRSIPPTPAPAFGRPQGAIAGAPGFAPAGAPHAQIRALGPATGTQVFGRPSQIPQQAPPADGGEAALRRALASASREVIERIAWEVVPQIAETVVREHLERLIKDREKGS